MTKILAINALYRASGITCQTVEAMIQAIETAGATVKVIHLREYHIKFSLIAESAPNDLEMHRVSVCKKMGCRS